MGNRSNRGKEHNIKEKEKREKKEKEKKERKERKERKGKKEKENLRRTDCSPSIFPMFDRPRSRHCSCSKR